MITLLIPLLLLIAGVNVIFGAIILSRGFRVRTNILFALIALATTFWSLAIIGFYSPEFRSLTDWTIFTHLFALMVATLFFYFSAEFPKSLVKGRVGLYLFALVPALVSAYSLLITHQVVYAPGSGDLSYVILPGYFTYALTLLFYFGFGYINLYLQYRQTNTAIARLQVRDVLVGSLLSSSLAIIPDLFFPYFKVFQFTWLGPIFTLILVVSIFVGILRHNLFNIRVLLTEVFVVLIILLLLVEIFLSTSPTAVIVTAAVLVLVAVLSFLLIKGVYREVEQREKIEILAKDLEETNDRQEKLIHFVGHEVKGYLTKGEYAFSEMVDGDFGTLPPQTKILSTTALSEMRKGVKAVTDILKAANLKRGTVTYDKKPVDLRDVVREEIIKLSPAAKEKGLTLSAELDDPGKYVVSIDQSQFGEHVIRNLIDNSIKYTPTGSVTVSLSNKEGKVIFSVKDTGVGIDDEDRAHLFTEGGTGKDSLKINVHSTGYGLYIAKTLVEAHDGKIWVESEGKGKGSTFLVELSAV